MAPRVTLPPAQDRPVLGVGLMLCFCMLIPFADALAKLLGGTVALGVLLLVRFGVQALLLTPMALVTGRPWPVRRRVFGLAILRTFLQMLGIGAMFTALRYLPLADAVAIAFVMPFISLLLGKYLLAEAVGPRRFAACCLGFVGTLLVIQPSFANVGWPALWPVLVAVTFAFFMLVTRSIAKETDPIALQALSGIVAVIVLVPLLVVGHTLGWDALSWTPPTPQNWAMLLALGGVGTLAHLLMTWSLRFAPSATLAPMQYLEIPFATLIGWWIFDDLPRAMASLGIALTIGAGLYIILRERASQQTTS